MQFIQSRLIIFAASAAMIGILFGFHAPAVQAADASSARYDATVYATLEDFGASIIVRRIDTAREVVGGFKQGPRSLKNAKAFVLTKNGFEGVINDPSTDFSATYGINDHNQVVGAINTATSIRPFRSTRLQTFNQLALLAGDNGGIAYDINNPGEIAGYSSGKTGEHAVWWSAAGVIHSLNSLPNSSSQALGINDSGDIVGISRGAVKHAVLWPGKGNVVDLGTLPGFSQSEAVSINNQGEIVGYAIGNQSSPIFSRAVLWAAGGQNIQDIGTLPGGDESRANDINERGEVVGTSTSDHGERAFIWTAGNGMLDLNNLVVLPGVVLTQAVGINSRGDIVVFGHSTQVDPAHAADDHEDHEQPRQIYVLTARP